MLLSYTAHVTKEKNKYTAIIYTLPIRYSFKNKSLSDEEATQEALGGIAKELDSYLRAALKKKMPFPLPYTQPLIMNDYDVPVPLDLAFILILRIFRSTASQKELAEQLGKSAAYLSSIESLETGVTLSNAHEMLSKLGIKASLTINPYRAHEGLRFQYATDPYSHIPIISRTEAPNLDVYYSAQYRFPAGQRPAMPFPANIKAYPGVKDSVFEITIPELESYNLDVVVVDFDEERVRKRASTILNLLLLSCDKKIKYPLYKKEIGIVGLELWSETAKKLFPKELKEFIISL